MADKPSKILIVDKSEKIRGLLADHLKSHGYQAEGVANGLEGAIRMRQSLPDLVIIDQEVPMGGVKTARLLRLHPSYQRIPVILTIDRKADLTAIGTDSASA